MYWSGNKQPTTAILFSFVGGIIVLANGLDRVYIPKYALFPPAVLASVGLLSGALVLLSTLLLWAAPRQHRCGASLSLRLLLPAFSLVAGCFWSPFRWGSCLA